MKTATLAMIILGAALTSSGCALTSKGETLDIRWFSPERAAPRLTSATTGGATAKPQGQPLELELGRVVSGPHLRARIAYRERTFEVGYYDERRWTERPEVYVRRALARTLFEEDGVRRAVGATAPILDVEVVAFEEVRGPNPVGRVALHVILRDEESALFEKTMTVDRPIPPGSGIGGVVFAIADALDGAVREVTSATEAKLMSFRHPTPAK